MRVFLDTNVLVAAFATRGLCEDVLRTILAEHELVVSKLVLEELERVLAEKLGMPRPRVGEATKFIRSQADVVNPTEPSRWPENDPDDRWIIAAAVVGEAAVLVTGDRDLLDVAGSVPVSIVTPRGFWEGLR
jgi:putative PIN family toxin of toxin-antitoxin system